MTVHLPANPNFEQLKGLAKTLRDLVRAGAVGAIELTRSNHPKFEQLQAGDPDAAAFKLADAQLTLARHYGFPSWPKLRAYVEEVQRLARSPHLVTGSGDLADELLRLGCLDYGTDDRSRPVEARALLAAHPEVATASIHTAAAVGDATSAAALLEADPAGANRQGGLFGWEPLLYLTYSRIDSPEPAHDVVATARVLLARGADPNAGFLWDGLVPPFTALTGALGGGERQEPPHPRWRELTTLLLDAGADPNDHQAAYNRGPGDLPCDDTDFLELLYDYGLGQGDGGPWRRRLGNQLPAPADLIAELLQHAAQHDLRRRARLLLAHGADPNRPALHPLYLGRTPYQEAMRNGNLEIAGLLEAAGASTSGIDAVGRLVARVMAGQTIDARAEADLLPQAIARDPAAIVRAAELGRVVAVRRLAELGWDVHARTRGTALHEAAFRGNEQLVDVLLELGADPNIRDVQFNGTPAGWAHHGGHAALAERLGALELDPSGP